MDLNIMVLVLFNNLQTDAQSVYRPIWIIFKFSRVD